MPTRRHVCYFEHRLIQGDNLLQGKHCGLIRIGIIASKELPAVIVLIVRDVKDRCVVERDWTQRENRAIAWLIERPVGFSHRA